MPSRFWSGLEALPGLVGIPRDWRRVWREEAPVGRAFLRPTGDLATSYPCPSPGGEGCPRKVVIHREDDIVAVCQSEPRQCGDVKLRKADIALLGLNWKALGTAVARGLGLSTPDRQQEVLPATVRLGWHHLVGGNRAAVYLTIRHDPQSLAATLSRLLAVADPPFILAAPTANLCQSDGAELLRRRGVLFLPLAECLEWSEQTGFAATARANALLADFAAHASPAVAPAQGGRRRLTVRVRPPAGTKWSDLRVTMDDLSLRYAVGGEQDTWGFAEAGFEDRRRRNLPDQVWELLQAFARGGGPLQEDAVEAKLKAHLKQHVSVLRRRLHALFDIPGPPIMKRRGESYRAAFSIQPRDGVPIPVPADCSWSGSSILETRTGRLRFLIETKERYLALAGGRFREFSREVAERVATRTTERTLSELGLLGDDREPTAEGLALLEVLRNGGRIGRRGDDGAMERLCGRLCHLTGIDESPFSFAGGVWTACFEAGSEVRRR